MRLDGFSIERPQAWALPSWLPTVALIGVTAMLGPSVGAIARPVFIVACGAVGWAAWRRDPAAHLQSLLALFAFAPCLRRLVDLNAGFDASGVMLAGPLLSMMMAGFGLLRRTEDRPAQRPIGTAAPLVLVSACIAYATALSLLQGDVSLAISGALKWSAPLVYAAALVRSPLPSAAFLSSAASAFLVIIPLMGVYGVVQYVDPPAWDRYWMAYASIVSAGEPIPFGVRTFSTMNSPASFATFMAAGLIVVSLLRHGWQLVICAAPAAPALLLSTYRTAWISLAAAIVFCCLFQASRRRALMTLVGGAAAVLIVAVSTPFGAVIVDRIASLGGGAQDGSAEERLSEFATLWTQWDSGLFGNGFTATDAGSAGAMPIDGTIVSCWFSMGIVVGLICLFGLAWAIFNAVSASLRDRRQDAILTGALAFGAMTQIPLAGITAGELGFLFWTFVVLLPRPDAVLGTGVP